MLAEIYIEAPLVDEELADLVWELLDRGVISDSFAGIAWWLVATQRTSAFGLAQVSTKRRQDRLADITRNPAISEETHERLLYLDSHNYRSR